MSIIVTGDDAVLPVQLKKRINPNSPAQSFAISPSATIKAAVIDAEKSALLAGPVTLSNAAAGADWPNSLVIVEIPSAATAAISAVGPAVLEIQVDDGGKLTWFADVKIVKGFIT